MSKFGKIAIAVVLGILAAIFGMLYIQQEKQQALGSLEMERVWIASEDIKPNTAIAPDMLDFTSVPKLYLQPGSITLTEVPNKADVQGITLTAIRAGEQIVRTKLWAGRTPPLSKDMKGTKGKLAVSVAIGADAEALGGLITPGDHVDVLSSFEFERGQGEHYTEVRPMFQDIEVLAVNKTTKTAWDTTVEKEPGATPTEEAVKIVTLSLSPADAQEVILAQQLGHVWFLLRGEGDQQKYSYEAWNNDRLLGPAARLWRAEDKNTALMKAIARARR